MRWVNDTLPPRARARWLLITMRLSIRSLTGTERTLVAVGTLRLAYMFWTVRAGAPRRTLSSGSSLASGAGSGAGSFGTGAVPAEEAAARAFGLGVALAAGVGTEVRGAWSVVAACLAGACEESWDGAGLSAGAAFAGAEDACFDWAGLSPVAPLAPGVALGW